MVAFSSLFLVGQLLADPIDASQASQIAKRFFASQEAVLRSGYIKELTLSAVALRNADAKLELLATAGESLRSAIAGSEVYYYIFNRGQHEGYVIVAGDDQFPSIVGYSLEGAIDLENAPSYIKGFLSNVTLAMENALVSGQETLFDAMRPFAAKSLRAGLPQEVSPLMEDIKWNQDDPWDRKTPVINGVRTPVGCVATALSQIMRYHEWPEKGEGQFSYKDVGSGQTLSANFGATTYNYSLMPKNFDGGRRPTAEEGEALSQFCSHVGIACKMNYSVKGSGAYSFDASKAMRNHFRYDKGLTAILREGFGDSEWFKLIFEDIAAGYPVYYAGSSGTGEAGHAFVFDGYDHNGYVHVNWGWGGMSNAFFNMNILNPASIGIGGGSGGGYNTSQEAMIGIRPDKTGSSKLRVPFIYYQDFAVQIDDVAKEVRLTKLNAYSYDIPYSNGKVSLSIIPIGGEIMDGVRISASAIKDIPTVAEHYSLDVSGMKPATEWKNFKDGLYMIRPVYFDAISPTQWMPMRFTKSAKFKGSRHALLRVSGNGTKWEAVKGYNEQAFTSIAFTTNKPQGASFLFKAEGFGTPSQQGLNASPLMDGSEQNPSFTSPYVILEGFITKLAINNAGITDFKVNSVGEVTKLSLRNNEIPSVTISGMDLLDTLDLSYNKITSILFEMNGKLQYINMAGNPLGGKEMGKVLSSLPMRTSPKGYFVIQEIDGTPGGKDAYAYQGDVRIANSRGWMVVTYNSQDTKFPYRSYQGVATANEDIVAEKVSVYPIPASEELHVTGLSQGEVVRLYTVSGQLVKEVTTASRQTMIPLEEIPSGYYVLVTENDKFKVVVEK